MIIKIQNYNKKLVKIFFLIFIFLINLSIEYNKYLDFIDEEVYEVKAEVLNIYEKPKNNILRLKAQNFDFFANIDKSEYTLASFVSPSGEGVKAFVQVNSNAEHHTSTYNQVANYYQEITSNLSKKDILVNKSKEYFLEPFT